MLHRRPALAPLVAIVMLFTSACTETVVSLQYPTHPQAVPAVSRLLSDDPVLAQEAKVELTSLGDTATPELLRRMKGASPEGKVRILELATQIGAPPAVIGAIYSEAVRDTDVRVRQGAAFQAARAPKLSAEVGPPLRRLLTDRVPEVKAAAITTLGSFNDEQLLSREDLALFIEDSNPLICASAVVVALKRDDAALRPALVRALPRLVSNLHSTKPATRAAIISALGQYGPAAAPTVPPLIRVASKDPVPEIRIKAAIALMRLGTPEARQAALETFQGFAASSNASLKSIAEGYLRSNGGPDAREQTPQ